MNLKSVKIYSNGKEILLSCGTASIADFLKAHIVNTILDDVEIEELSVKDVKFKKEKIVLVASSPDEEIQIFRKKMNIEN